MVLVASSGAEEEKRGAVFVALKKRVVYLLNDFEVVRALSD